jgi:pimeloyl-ACP methyl ester carboxylesterase
MKAFVLVHGLNNTPEIFSDIINVLPPSSVIVNVTLTGHIPGAAQPRLHPKIWLEDVRNAMKKHEHIHRWTGIGFSLGGLVLTHLALEHPYSFERLILLAPALAVRRPILLLKLFTPFSHIHLTSFTPLDIRAHKRLNMTYYRSLFQLQHETCAQLQTHRLPHTTVFISPHDELLQASMVKRLFKDKAIIVPLKTKRRYVKDYAHLLVKKSSLCDTDWQMLVSVIVSNQHVNA